MPTSKSRRIAIGLTLLGMGLLLTGCNGDGVGETVPSPPRSLVEKTGPRPAAMVQPGTAAAPAAGMQTGSDAGKQPPRP
jgi:hypothetical protein